MALSKTSASRLEIWGAAQRPLETAAPTPCALSRQAMLYTPGMRSKTAVEHRMAAYFDAFRRGKLELECGQISLVSAREQYGGPGSIFQRDESATTLLGRLQEWRLKAGIAPPGPELDSTW